jgi:8-oxo-dGTP pyrophosphatase MutT (NUDIX family)
VNCKEVIDKMVKILKQEPESLNVKAAVVVLLKVDKEDFEVLLVKRAETPTDVWSGQIAFPGGKCDVKDIDIKATVIRETLEETGINLLLDCRFLGTLGSLRSVEKPEMEILPFVVLQKNEQTIKLNEELAKYFWVSLKDLDKHKRTVKLSQGEFPAYITNENFIWGLTYNILQNLLALLTKIKKKGKTDFSLKV